MRKLKTLLILLFAACLSFTLFACGGGDDDKDKDGSTSLNRVSGNQIELTDADTQDTFNTKMQTYKLTGSTDEGRVEILGSDCDITGTINFGVIDRYTVKFTPKTNNENGVSAEVVVVIDHAWGAPDADGKEVCAHDGATRITKDEDVAIHYGGFHYGTGASAELGQDPYAATALPQVVLTEEQASAIGLHAETATGAAFKTAAGINDGKTSSGRIKEFGNDERAGKVVPTITAGDLAPGMSITIEGYAKTDVVGGTDSVAVEPWNATNGNWNCPSYGIADPYSPLCTMANGGIDVGTSVIVRSEGWVLYNGIGQELKNTLGGLPKFIEGGSATESGSTDKANCASWDRATADTLTGQDVTNRPAYTSSDWKDWWVYSEGQDRHSLDSYQSFVHVRVTWTYHTYGEGDDQVGIIVIDSDYLDEDTTFRSYIKVPAATRGAYRTIIHGDYSTLLITKSSYIETETVTDMKVNGLKSDAKTEYLAGEQIDAGAVFDMQVQSVQNTNWHDGGIAVTNDMLYYYVGGTTYAEAEADVASTEATKWVAVGDNPLTTDMKFFKIVLERADDTFHRMVPETACNTITIHENNVLSAVGDEYSTALNSRDPMATYTRSLGKDGSTYYVDLTINKVLFRAIPAGAADVFESAPGSDYRYTAIRILGIAADGFASITEEQKKTGTLGSDTYYYTYQTNGDDVLLAIAIKKAMLGQALTIEGVQDTDIRITFGTTSLGFDVSSTISYTNANPTLNAGGEVTVAYENLPTTEGNFFQVYAGGASNVGSVFYSATTTLPAALGTSGITLTGYATSGTTTTVTFKFPAFDFANWTTMPYIRATDSNISPLAEDYVEYNLALTPTADATTAANQSEGDAYFYAQDDTLYFVTVAQKITAAGTDADLETITGGVTVNINNGSADTAKSFDLSYKYSAGTLAFADEGLGDGCALQIVTLEKAYGDYGVIAVASVNIADATGFTGDFGFQIDGVDANSNHYWKYNATAGKIEYTAISGTLQKTVLAEGDCYTTGIVASEVKSGTATVFLAEYTEVGGHHVMGSNGKCELCGATITEDVVMKDWDDGFTGAAYTITPGTIIDVTGSVKDSTITDVGGNWGPFVSIIVPKTGGGNTRYWLRTDGCNIEHPNDSWDAAIACYPGNVDALGADTPDENFYTSLAYNTLNGAIKTDGTAIETATFGDFIAGKSFRYIVSFIGTTIKVEFNYYNPDGTLALNYYVEIRNVAASSATAQFISDNMSFLANDGKVTVAQSTVNKSVVNVDETEGAEVQGHDASDVTFAADGFDANGNAKLAVTGMASNEGTTHYLAFKVAFTQPLAETTTAALFQADGTTAFEGGYVNLNSDRDELEVYVPVTATTGSFLIKFTNFKASTMQSDIVVDLANLGVSDVTAALTDNLTLGANSTFTIAYSNVQATDELTVGTWTKALSAITTTGEAITGTDLTVKANAAIASGAVTLTFTKAASDLSKVIPGYEIKLMRGTSLIAINKVAPATAVPTGDLQIEESGWYAKAEGTTLYLYGNNKTSVNSLPFNVNAGHATDEELLGVADLGFKVVDGVVKFEKYSALRAAITTVYTDAATSLTVFIIDLTDLGVDAATVPYGFAIEDDTTEHADAYYTVAATTRDITKATGGLSDATDTTIKAHSATEEGITVRFAGSDKDAATYYGYVAVIGHTFPAEGGKCTGCDAVGWQKNDVKVGKTDNSVDLGGTGEHGDEKAYNPDTNERFHVLVKGMTIVAEGELTSDPLGNANGVGAYLYPATQTTHNWDFFRIDNWINLGADGQSQEAATIEAWKFTVAKSTSITGVTTTGDPWPTINQIKANAHIVVTWDWTAADGKTIVLTFTITNPDMRATFVDRYTITSSAAGGEFEQTKYAIGLVPVAGSFTGSIMAYGPASVGSDVDQCNPQLHTHSYDPESGRCSCGALDPDHVHNYNQNTNTTCACGAVKPDHTHVYANGYCTTCGHAQAGAISYEFDGKTYTGTLVDQNIVNNDKSVEDGGNGLAWWSDSAPAGYAPASTPVTIAAGDFLLVWNWTQLTIDPQWPHDAVIEMFNAAMEYIDQGFMQSSGAWGVMMDKIKASCQETITHNGQAAAVPGGADATGFYTARIARIGTTLIIEQIIVNVNDGSTWKVVDTYTGAETAAWTACITGNPYGCENLTGYYTALTEQNA